MIQGNGELQEQERDTEPVNNQNVIADIWELAWLPLALAIVAAGVTWAVWYHTTEPGKPESAKPTGCSLTKLEKCISLDLLNKMFTHGAIAGGTGGIWNYIMLRRERQAREAAERRAELAEKRVDEERRRADEERQQLINRILELTSPSNDDQEQTTSESA